MDTNTDSGTFENNELVLGDATWVSGQKNYYSGGNSNQALTESEARNFFSITAGDYNADGKDTIVAYACLQGDTYGLFEINYKDGELSLAKDKADQTLLNSAYNKNSGLHDVKGNSNTSGLGYKLKGAVTTGDLDNDGIEDLAVVSEMGEPYNTYNHTFVETDENAKEAYVAVAFGQDGLQDSIVGKSDTSTYISDDDTSITSTQLDIGNISTDGYNKLTVAGYKIAKNSDNIYQPYGKDGKEALKTETYFFSINKGQLKQYGNKLEKGISTENLGIDNYYVVDCLNMVPVCSACVDGYGQQEQLFINGYICKLQEKGGVEYINTFFDDIESNLNLQSEIRYFYDVAPVTVDNNNHGIEQFVVTYMGVGSYGSPTAMLAIVKGNASYAKDGTLTQCTDYTVGKGFAFNRAGINANFTTPTNIVAVAYEKDENDALVMRLNHKGYYYSDPEPVAVLQAAPYFKEIGASYAGTTQYSLTASYTEGSGKTTSSTIGGGLTETVAVGPNFMETFTTTYKSLISQDFKESKRDSFTTTFTATSKDTVVIQTTPVVYYSYDMQIYDNDKKDWEWKENQTGITVAQIPTYIQITVDQYNDFVTYYNNYVNTHAVDYEAPDEATDGTTTKTVKLQAEPLLPIDKDSYGLGNSGNPAGYFKAWSGLLDGKRVSRGAMALGYQGGTTTNNYGYETSETETHTKGWTADCTLTLQVGTKVANLVQGWAGALAYKATGCSYSSFVTTGNGYSIAGTVKNLDAETLTKSEQLSEDSVKAYGFQWTFGLSDFTSHKEEESTSEDTDTSTEDTDTSTDADENADVPVVCYVLNNVTKGIQAPTLKSLEVTDEKKLEISWDAPEVEEGQTIDGYNVYLGDIDGNFKKLTDTPISADDTSYVYEPEDGNQYYTFLVTAVGKASTDATKDIESLPSKAKSIIYDSSKKDTIHVGVDNQTLTYGDELTLYPQSLVLPDGVEMTDILLNNLEWVTAYETGSPVGNYMLTMKGIESDKYNIVYDYSIITVKPKELTEEDISFETEKLTYDGSAKEPEVTVKGAKKDTDYTVSYVNNTNPGTATVTITGIGNYTGTITKDFTIAQKKLTDDKVSIETKDYTYDGKAKEPLVTVKGFEKGTDYTVSYTNNINAGTATVTVSGIGNYTGSVSKNFTIKKAAQSVKIKTSKKYVKYKKVKKKATYSTAIKVKGAKGQKTYVKVGGSKKLKINKNTGKIMVMKNTKKGTYKIKVKVISAATENYNAKTSKTKTIKVRVK